MMSTQDIKELVMAGFIAECDCATCSSNTHRFKLSRDCKFLSYRIPDTNYFILFFQVDFGFWDPFYILGSCPYEEVARRYLTFEEIWEGLPEALKHVGIFHLDILAR